MPPPEFRGTDPTTWSPEDFFVAAAASCLAVTFTGLAERAGLTYTSLRVDADGVAGMRLDGRFGFTRLVLRLEVESDPADQERIRELARKAEDGCLVSASLDLSGRDRDRADAGLLVVAAPDHPDHLQVDRTKRQAARG